ncbi:MAG: ATP synthase F1 subunit delta [Clostridia bacterium]|nr:ATP synthase F1 subunit delta [Clostridia bacterium]
MTQTNKEYATALFSLATEGNSVDQYEKSLIEIGNIFKENPDYIKVLESPAIPLSERIAFIDKAFEGTYTEYLVSFIKVLCENGHITEIISCIDAFCDLVRIYKNRTIATIYYVEPLTEEQKASLIEKLQKISGKVIEPEYIKDEGLIGGIKVQIDDKIFDGSVRNRLNKAKGEMNK